MVVLEIVTLKDGSRPEYSILALYNRISMPDLLPRLAKAVTLAAWATSEDGPHGGAKIRSHQDSHETVSGLSKLQSSRGRKTREHAPLSEHFRHIGTGYQNLRDDGTM